MIKLKEIRRVFNILGLEITQSESNKSLYSLSGDQQTKELFIKSNKGYWMFTLTQLRQIYKDLEYWTNMK